MERPKFVFLFPSSAFTNVEERRRARGGRGEERSRERKRERAGRKSLLPIMPDHVP